MLEKQNAGIRLKTMTLAAALVLGAGLSGCAGGTAAAPGEPGATAEPEPTPEPLPVVNPLTGLDDGDYNNARPIAVMLRTLDGATPQWGVATADVLVEGVTEGTSPALMALYPSVDSLNKVGPIAGGRDLMLQFALPLNAIPVEINKNIYAQNLLNTLTYQDLDGLHIGTAAFSFDEDRKSAGYREENCWYTTPDLIRAGLTQYGLDTGGANTPLFTFAEKDLPDEDARNATELTIGFSAVDAELLAYNPDTQTYHKQGTDGSPVTDGDSGAEAEFTNVFVFYASSGIKDDGYTREYDMTAGTGLYLYGGGWQQINWTKQDATGPFELTTIDDEPLTVAPGKSFVAVWGGYYGQSISLTGADGSDQALPDRPALLESGITDEQAIAAEEALSLQQAVVDAQAAVDNATLDLAYAEGELQEAQEALAAAQETEDTADDEAAAALVAEKENRIAELTAYRDEQQAIVDAANPPAEEGEGEGEGEEQPAEEEAPPEESAAG